MSQYLHVCDYRLYPLLLRKLGLTSTGLLGFTTQSLCLLLCLASVRALCIVHYLK